MNRLGRFNLAFLGLIVLLALSACGGRSPQELPLPGGDGADASNLDTPSYTMAAGDRLRVNVFRHEDLSGEFEIDGNGNFSMPLIGQVPAFGLTSEQVERRIEDLLKNGYLVDPQVSIEVLTYRPFYIIGEVNRPGSFEYTNGMTVINAVALAGGFSYRANQDSIELQRGGSNAPKVVVSPTTRVLPGDIITVDERFF